MTSSFPKSAMHGGEMGVRTPLKGGGTKKRKKNGVFSLGKKGSSSSGGIERIPSTAVHTMSVVYIYCESGEIWN